jgi:hypothetical protein
VAAYGGTGNFPYWMTIANSGGVAGAGAQSENIPVAVGSTYQFTAVCSFASTWASGAQIVVTFYDVNSNQLSTSTVTQTNMTGGTLYQLNSGLVTAPASSSYAVAQILIAGNPVATNLLSVYQAEFADQNNNQVNVNFTFTYTYWPWSAVNTTTTLAWTFNNLIGGDSDSLVIDDVIELMGGGQGVQCLVPELLDSNGQGPTFRILAPPSLNSSGLGYQSSYELNAPQPTQDVVASMLLDGERPFGDRASNRTINLPVVIFGTQAGGMNQVLKAREYLMAIIDQQTYPIKWTPADTGLPLIFDCFRALPSNPVYGFNYSSGGSATGQTIGRPNYPIGMITLSIQALPYGRSAIDGVQNLSFASPISGGINPQTVSASTIDTFSTVFSAPPIINAPVWTSLGFANPTAVATSFNVTTTATAAVGTTIFLEIQSATNNVTSVTDTGGNVYTLAGVQGTGGACFQFIYTAPVTTALSSGTITVNVGTSGGNYSSVAYRLQGGWSVTKLFGGSGTASTFSQNFNVSQYNMVISVCAGLGGGGGAPPGFTIFGNNFGNGFNNVMYWYSQPLNQSSLAFSDNSLPNPYSLMVFAFTPSNQYWTLDTTTAPSTFIGNSVRYSPPRPFKTPYPAAVYQQTLTTPVSIVGNPVFSFNFGQSYDVQWPKDPKFISNVTFQFTLTDDQSRTISFSKAYKNVKYGTHSSAPKWTTVNALIPQGKAFDYNAVTAYSVRITNWSGSGHTGYVRMYCWLNDVVANPQTLQYAVSPRGNLVNLLALPGSARSPVSVQCQLPATQNVTKEITGPASGNWIVPPGVYAVQAETWAGGGAGAAANLSRTLAGGGGGGGEYAQEPALSVMPGQQVPWSIGGGGTPGQLIPTVVQYTRAGLGHWTCPANVSNILVESWGGGAAGGAGAGGAGGAEYSAANVPVTPGVTYSVWTGAAGRADTGKSAAQIHARQGTASWFGPAAATNTPAYAYVTAKGGSTSLTGSSSGGYGGSGGKNVLPSAIARTGFTIPAGNVLTSNMPATTSAGLLTAGDTGLVVVTVTAAATITVSDTAGNKYNQIGSSSNTGAFTYVFATFDGKPLTNRGHVTVTQNVSQHLMGLFFDVPGVVAVDVASVAASGTGTSAPVTSNNSNYTGDAVFAIYSTTGADTNGVSAGWKIIGGSFNPNVSPTLNVDVFEQTNPTTTGLTCTATYAASQVWSALTLSLIAVTRFAGGRGGSSPGPSGGGGGGAGGATGAGSAGGNSLPFVANVGHWQQGGAGGAGNGQGGTGGAGANTPGFPGVGAAPGGGGGGGYQTQPLFNPANPSKVLPGQQQTNFLGGDGGIGMVQLTYTVGGGLPVNGGNTSFGSTALTGTIVTAHGGTSAANNSAAGGAGGTGSSNTIHSAGGAGGFIATAALGSYMPSVFQGFFTTLTSGTWNAATVTSGTSAASVSQGVSIALIASAAEVTDLVVTDSAGNVYQLQGINTAQAAGAGIAVYAYVADIEFPITTSTTMTVTSATSQQYGLIWYGSPWLVGGVTSGNSGSNHGTSATATAQFGVADPNTIEWELGVVVCDTSRTVSSAQHGGATWFNASSTNALTFNSTCQLSAFVAQNQGGGTGVTGTGDTFQANLSGSGNWATLAIPLAVINQQATPAARFGGFAGTVPGSQTTWNTNGLAIQAQGMLVVAGMCGSGASISAGPTAIADSAGNAYTFRKTTLLPSNSGTMWIATAPVTGALPATATGTINWGTASAAPNYAFDVFWVPNASGVDANGVSAATGTNSTPSGTYTPASPNDFVFAHSVAVSGTNGWGGWPIQYNWVTGPASNYMKSQGFATQAVDLAVTPFSVGLSTAMPWGLQLLALQMNLAGTGGGAAGGPGGPGYPGVWQFGGPGYTGGGKGGQGAAPPPQYGNGASYPGGGGGGCYAVSGTAQEGGQGAPGALRLTWAPPLQTFNTLLVHSLGSKTHPRVNPCIAIPITDTPNNTEYAVPSVDGLLPAVYNSTYTVLLSNFYWNSITSSAPRQITVTINQYEYPGGPKYSVQASRAVVPATDSVNGLLSMGEVTLPVKEYAAYNDQSYFTVSINDTDTSDRFQDVLLLDTLGQSVLINIDPGQSGYGEYVNFFIDEATSDRDLGFVGASFQDRQHQMSVLDYAQISGGALYVGPGDNLFFAYSPAGAPNISLQYAPRWYLDRTS